MSKQKDNSLIKYCQCKVPTPRQHQSNVNKVYCLNKGCLKKIK